MVNGNFDPWQNPAYGPDYFREISLDWLTPPPGNRLIGLPKTKVEPVLALVSVLPGVRISADQVQVVTNF